VNFAKIAMA